MQKKKRKKNNKKKKNSNLDKKIFIYSFFIVILFIMIVFVGYLFFNSDVLKSTLNSTTASYISFNNRYNSDTMKIDSLKKLSDLNGKNSTAIDLKVDNENSVKYEIVLVPINVSINYKNIKVYLTDKYNSQIFFKKLNNFDINKDGEIIIYRSDSNINKVNSYKFRMWIDNNYRKEINANSFEIKVKLG